MEAKQLEPKQLNVLIPAELSQELKRFCFENDKKKKDVVEMALNIFLSNKPKK